MPGDNCAVFGCGSCRREKGIGIWKLPAAKDEEHKKWREDWLREITKTRQIDQDFRKRIESDKVFTCEKHFEADDIEIFQSEKMTKKKPRFGAIPKLKMPKRSHESPKPMPRPTRSVVKNHEQQPQSCYKSFGELCHRVLGLKSLSNWKFKTLPDRLIMKKTVEPFLLPEVEIMVDDSLGYTVKAFGCFLPEDHAIYLNHKRSVRNISVCGLLKELEIHKLCCGVKACELTSKLFHHVIPVNEDPLKEGEQCEQFPNKCFWRYSEYFVSN